MRVRTRRSGGPAREGRSEPAPKPGVSQAPGLRRSRPGSCHAGRSGRRRAWLFKLVTSGSWGYPSITSLLRTSGTLGKPFQGRTNQKRGPPAAHLHPLQPRTLASSGPPSPPPSVKLGTTTGHPDPTPLPTATPSPTPTPPNTISPWTGLNPSQPLLSPTSPFLPPSFGGPAPGPGSFNGVGRAGKGRGVPGRSGAPARVGPPFQSHAAEPRGGGQGGQGGQTGIQPMGGWGGGHGGRGVGNHRDERRGAPSPDRGCSPRALISLLSE